MFGLRGRFLSVLAFGLAIAPPATAAEPAKVDFNRDIKPILAKNCFACHGPDGSHREAGLRLDALDAATKARRKGAAIVPGKPGESRLIARVSAADPEERMPPPETGNVLSADQIAKLKAWVEQGAPYAEHWAFVKPKRPELPAVKDRAWPRNPIDFFILAEIEKAGLRPSEPADRFILLRRTSLDIRGLPPTPQEVEAFANDPRPDAYERMVDRFLNDSAYGERWARVWLDLARYADSAGYGSDPLRPHAWRYRDWVIDAFNSNMPFDRFTIEQLAGDLLPNPTLEQKVATGFHRNTMTNTEGGTDDEEFRVAAIKDRVDTTAQVWMGLTMGCAKCHTHKFDPVTQQEYYRFFAIFNETADSDRPDESPTIPAPARDQIEKIRRMDARIAELKKQLDRHSPQLATEQSAWEADLRPTVEGKILPPLAFRSANGAKLTKLPDGSLRASGTNRDRDTYTVTFRAEGKGITGFRLEVLPDGELPGDGSFVLSRVSATAGAEGKALSGKFVRIEIPGPGKILSLAEVQVFRGGVNVAPKGKALQSSTMFGGLPHLAIDANTNGDYHAKSTTHTTVEANPWWEVNLAESGPVERIVIWNRLDGGLHVRLANFRVSLLDEGRNVVWTKEVKDPPNPSLGLSLGGPQAVKLADAFADTTQDGFAPAHVLAPPADGKRGWSVGPVKGPHSLLLVLEKPLSLAPQTDLTFRFEHRGLGRFRLSAITDPRLLKRLDVPAAVRSVIDTPPEKRTPEQRESLAKHFRTVASSLRGVRSDIARVEKTRPQPPLAAIMQELPPDKRRKTRLLIKGDFLNPGEEVQPGLPAAFPSLPKDAPMNRLGVAKWLVSPDNPLTARVAVNRMWAQLFGQGLVESEEDFGTQGELPTHPELLDWLATEYVCNGWDTKALLRLIVTSSTYRQSSKVTPELLRKDPKNHLYARAPRFRLEAEMVRDQALLLSGLLSRKVGGPSVYPPQPSGLWQAAFNGQRNWPTSKGEDRYRRGLYTFWRRTVPYPSMATFDAPSREICSVKRVRTNTPLQAFVTLNDPAYVEAAQALARRIVKEGGASPEDRAAYGLKLCLSRPPKSEQVAALLELYRSELANFRKDPKKALALATDPLGPLPEGMDAAELAAWTVVANVLLNLDGVLTKG